MKKMIFQFFGSVLLGALIGFVVYLLTSDGDKSVIHKEPATIKVLTDQYSGLGPFRKAVVFEWKYGETQIAGPTANRVFNGLNVGDKVNILYQDVYKKSGNIQTKEIARQEILSIEKGP